MAQSYMDFQCALVTGGGGGIGKALSQHFISLGKKVIIAGRTESNLRATAAEIGAAAYYVLDTGKTEDIPAFIARVVAEHPDLDCLVNNAGVQRPLDVNQMNADEFLGKADQEIDINIRGPLHLALRLLPHLRKKAEQEGKTALIVNVSSVLGFVPFVAMNPVYNGTKAWLHFWSVNLRTQLEEGSKAVGGKGTVRVVELAPPSVGTDLHREREDPDDNKEHKNASALTVDEYIAETTRQMQEGKETIGAGMAVDIVGAWETSMGSYMTK